MESLGTLIISRVKRNEAAGSHIFVASIVSQIKQRVVPYVKSAQQLMYYYDPNGRNISVEHRTRALSQNVLFAVCSAHTVAFVVVKASRQFLSSCFTVSERVGS